MAKYFKQRLVDGPAPKPAAQPLSGLQPMRRGPLLAAIDSQDKIASLSRRVLCTGGMRGAQGWIFANEATPRQTTPQTFPLIDTPRECCNAYVRLTPGCFPAIRVIFHLSGPCEENVA